MRTIVISKDTYCNLAHTAWLCRKITTVLFTQNLDATFTNEIDYYPVLYVHTMWNLICL